MASYNVMRSVEDLLTQYESSPPSFTIHLHREHWNMNNSHKFLYHGQPAVGDIADVIRNILTSQYSLYLTILELKGYP